jgi:hypothetical protein
LSSSVNVASQYDFQGDRKNVAITRYIATCVGCTKELRCLTNLTPVLPTTYNTLITSLMSNKPDMIA